ncbi:hypothetical protein KJE20_14301 [Pyrenophora tritici-repentis]|nr:hypothetical protein KJE20_14301 [Pyrenophora tritici-repentis]
MNNSAFPTGGFNFSSPPTFKPDAPVFNPGVSAFNPNKPATAQQLSHPRSLEMSLSLLATLLSQLRAQKLFPIVRPDNTRQKTPEVGEDRENREDEAGRPMQADGREKRVRRDRADGDDVPKFAIQPVLQSQPLAQFKEPTVTKPDSEIEQEELDTDKENLSPDVKRPTKSKSKSPEPLSRSTAPFEPISPAPISPALESDAAADDDTPHASDVHTPTTEEPVPGSKTHGHKSTLSANAKPFELRPQFSSAGYDFGFHVTKPSQVEDPEKTQVSPPGHDSQAGAGHYLPTQR